MEELSPTLPEAARATAPEPVEPAESHSSRTVTVLAFLCLAVALLQSLVSPAIADVASYLHAGASSATWGVTGFLLSLGICTSIVGRLGDLYGKRRVLIATIVVVMVGTLLSALATSLWLFVLGRVVQGAAGGLFPLSFAVIRDEVAPHKRAGAIGLISALLGLGGGLGVVLSGVIVDHLSVPWLFWFPLMAIGVGLVAAWVFVPESPVRAAGGISYAGAVLMAAGLSGVLLAVSQASSWGWGDVKTIGLGVLGIVLLVVWTVVESRSAHPLVDMTMMRQRTIWPVNLLALAIGFGLFSAFLLIPQYAESSAGFGDSVTAGALMLLPLSIVMIVVGPLAGRIEARWGAKLPAALGAVSVLAAFLVIALWHDSRTPVILTAALLGLGVGMAFAAMANLVVQSVPADQTGVATGVNTVARTVGGALGGQIAISLVTAVGGVPSMSGFQHSFWLMVGASVVGVAAALAVPAAHVRQQHQAA